MKRQETLRESPRLMIPGLVKRPLNPKPPEETRPRRTRARQPPRSRHRRVHRLPSAWATRFA